MRLLLALGLVVACLGWVGLRQNARHAALLEEQASLAAATDALRQARLEHARLGAVQVSATDLERLRADREALTRLQAEVSRIAPPPSTPGPEAPAEELLRQFRPEEWAHPTQPIAAAKATNAGRVTLGNTMETLLWSVASRDLSALGALIKHPQAGHDQPRRDFDAIASLVAADASRFTALHIASVTPPNHINTAMLVAHLQAADEAGTEPDTWKTRVRFILTREADGWVLNLPSGFASAYHDRLLTAAGADSRP